MFVFTMLIACGSITDAVEPRFADALAAIDLRNDDDPKVRFEAYKYRRQQRRMDALAMRRQINATKVHHYWTARTMPVSVMGGAPFIQRGWVVQPPIPVARYRVADGGFWAQARLALQRGICELTRYDQVVSGYPNR
jgi:hypothetical protein